MLIAISGKINTGKDEVGRIINFLCSYNNIVREGYTTEQTLYQEYLDWQRIGVPKKEQLFKIKKFADGIKDILCILIGCTREQLEDEDFKNKELGKEWWYYEYWQVHSYTEIVKRVPYNEYNPKEFEDNEDIKCTLVKLTPRKLTTLIGTDCGRNIIHPNIWINTTFNNYKEDRYLGDSNIIVNDGMLLVNYEVRFSNWIITDLRFFNEDASVRVREGVTIRINRPIFLRFPNLWKIAEASAMYKPFKFLKWLESYDIKTFQKLTHISETELDNHTFDYIINNDGSMEELIEKVKEILIDLKLIKC